MQEDNKIKMLETNSLIKIVQQGITGTRNLFLLIARIV